MKTAAYIIMLALCAGIVVMNYKLNGQPRKEQVYTINIVYELRRRGFDGVIKRLGEEPNDYESYDLQKQFEPKKFESDDE